MEQFIYHNIFQTKGVEYIIIIAFLLLLVPFWKFVNRKKRIVKVIRRTLGILSAEVLKAPSGLLFNRNHTWAHLGKSGIAQVGVDDWLQHVTGNSKLGFLKDPGDHVKKGEPLMEIKNNGKALRIPSPISGKVVNTNNNLIETPEIIEDDPYNEGWVYKIQPDDWKSETNNFIIGEETGKWFKSELERLKDFVAVSLGNNSPQASMVVMQEGGELRDHPLTDMPKEVWQDFQKEFLD